MRKVLALLLACASLLVLTACTGFQGEGISNPSGDGIISLTGDGLRGPSISSGSGGSGGARASGAPRETSTGLSGTFRAADGSGNAMTFSGNKIVMSGPDFDDELEMIRAFGGSMTITYEIVGDMMAMTMTVSFMGETESFTEWLEFVMEGSDAFTLNGERFIR